MRSRRGFLLIGLVGAAGTIVLAACTGAEDDPGGDNTVRPPEVLDNATGGGGGGGGQGGQGGTGSGSALPVLEPIQQPQVAPCPADMVLVEAFCMDRFEAPNIEGEKPLVMQSAITAEAWCLERGKRLCTEDEWVMACEGPAHTVYPYGDEHQDGACNDDKTWIAPDEAVLATWPSPEAQAEVDALYQGAPSGSYPGCVSSYGVYDLTGNVEEWVIRTQYHVNEYPHVMKGCYWSGCYGGAKPRCGSTNPAHGSSFLFYETGFRCCRDTDE